MPQIHFGIYSLVFSDNNKKILLVKKTIGPYEGLFDLPGGTPKKNETADETLRREFLEEVGTSLIRESDWIDFKFTVLKNSKGNPIHFEHTAKVCVGKIINDVNIHQKSEDTSGVKWHDISNSEFFSPLVKNALNLNKLNKNVSMNNFVLINNDDRFYQYKASSDTASAWIKYLCSQKPYWQNRFFNEQSFYERHACGLNGEINIPHHIGGKTGEYLVLEFLQGKVINTNRFSQNIQLNTSEIDRLLSYQRCLSIYNTDQIGIVFDKEYLLKQVKKTENLKLVAQNNLDKIIQQIFEMNFSLGVCHGDFLFKNIIRDGDKLYLIDWEYFGVSVKYWDLATLWLQLMDSNELQKEILKRVPLIDHEEFRLTVIGILLKEIRLDNETEEKHNLKRLLQIAGELIHYEN